MTLAVLLPRTCIAVFCGDRCGAAAVTSSPTTGRRGRLFGRTSSLGQQVLLVYAGLLAGLIWRTPAPALAASVGLGVLVLFPPCCLPPTGLPARGNSALAPASLAFGSGSVFIPWTEVEICAMDSSFFVVLTEKQEARVVYPPGLEEKVCRFVDGLLRRRGYEIG